jgi:hypothetical protein
MSTEGLKILTIPGSKDNHNREDRLSVTWGNTCLGIYPVQAEAKLLPAYEAAITAVEAEGNFEAGDAGWSNQVRAHAERAMNRRQPVAA